MAKKQSKHAARLRAAGCTPYQEILSREDMEEVDDAVEELLGRPTFARMTRSQRRELVKKGRLPGFTKWPDHAYIIDETGTDWQGPASIDYAKEFGFCDIRAELEALLLTKLN